MNSTAPENPLLVAALFYAAHGMHVFPCVWIENGACSCMDSECESPGKHPLTPHGLLDASNDPEVVRDFWRKFPKANIAIATGAKSGIAVVDIDDIHLAKPELQKICPAYDFKAVPMQQTGNGWHLVFGYPGVHVKTGPKFLPGMDSRGDGGYMMAAPSGHVSGRHYRWAVPLNGRLPPLPAALLIAINGPSANNGDRAKFDSSIVWEGIPEGQRDDQLFRYACQLRHYGAPRDVAEQLIVEAAARCKPPFPKSDALKKVDQAYRKYSPGGESSNQEKAKPPSEHRFSLISARDVMAAEDVEQRYIVEGMLPDGGMSLLVAKPKVGKTTLAFNLAVAVSRGADFLGRRTEQGPVVYLALEEKRGEIKKKLAAAGITDEPICFHFGSAPVDAMAQVEALIVETKAKLLIIDVLQKFCRLRDLNDYAIVTNALEPLMAAARKQGCHILLTHHAGKADRPDGDDILGSTGLLGSVDTSIHIKKRDKRRSFFTIQRYGDDITETVIDLDKNGYLEAIGSREHVEIDETLPAILKALDEEPLTEKEIWEQVEKKHDVVAKGIRLLVDRKIVDRTGNGKRGDPYRYGKNLSCFPQDIMGRAGRESENGGNLASSKEKSSPQNSVRVLLGDESPRKAYSAEIPKDPWDV
jgi:hypothetical protein